jgi:hypothetical protein
MSLFERIGSVALQSQHAVFGEKAATYTPPGDGQTAIPCTVILSKPDVDLDSFPGERKVFREGIVAELRASEIAKPEKGGTLQVGLRTMKILDAPRQDDPDRLTWSMLVK